MRITLGANIAAMKVLGQFRELDGQLRAASERLASGMRINRASDDAAGLSLLSTLRADSAVYRQGVRNINDAISMLSIAEGAIAELGKVTERQLELATRAATETLSGSQRLAIHKELNALVDEYNRIIESTEFNGNKLLDGSTDAITIQQGETSFTFSFGGELARTVGTGAFGSSTAYAAGGANRNIITADFNGDGYLDVATDERNPATSRIAVSLGSGDGTMGARVYYNVGGMTYDLAAGDFDHDGDVDIATADYGASGLGTTASILYNTGAGAFAAYSAIDVGTGPAQIAAGDLNNDGIDDVVASRASTTFTSGIAEVSTLGCGTNGVAEISRVTFSAAAKKEVSLITAGAAAGIAAGSYFTLNAPSGAFYVWFTKDGAGANPGAAGTGIQVDLLSTDTADQTAAKISAALDARGEFVAGALGNQITVTNDQGGSVTDIGAGTAGAGLSVSVSTQGTDSNIEAGDYFIASTPTNLYNVWFRIQGAGGAWYGTNPNPTGTEIQVDISYDYTADQVAAAVAAALDAKADVVASASTNEVTITRTELGGASTQAGTITGLSVTTLVNGVDALSSGSYFEINTPSTQYYVWYNIAGQGGNPSVAGKTGIQVNITWGDTGDQVAAATAAAIDASADFAASAASAAVTITNAAAGTAVDGRNVSLGSNFGFSVSQQGVASTVDIAADAMAISSHGFQTGDRISLTTTGTLPGGLATGTYYYVINADQDHIKLASSLANAQAGTAINLTSNGTGTHTLIGGPSRAAVRLSNGDGTFSEVGDYQVGSTGITLSDLNRDGILDLVSADISDAVQIRYGRGDGTFGGSASYTVGADPNDVAVGDFNADGIADIVSANTGPAGAGSTATVLFGKAEGGFESGLTLATGPGPYSVLAQDLNGDGYDDISTANFQNGPGNTLSVLLSNGDKTFAAAATATVGGSAVDVAAGDYNGDGVPDLAVSDRAAGTADILLANTTTTRHAAHLSVASAEDARAAMDELSANFTRVSNALAAVGAVQARMNVAHNQAASMFDEISAAADRISSADVAEEMSRSLRGRILQQAAAAVLAQANQQPDLVLTLL